VTSSRPTSRRLSWDEYFLKIVETIAERATCDRGRSGALLVSQRQILATGYVGSPPGFPHCDDVGHLFEDAVVDGETHCVRTVHAEQNALASAARAGIPVLGSTLYCTMAPCRVCAMLMITAGIDRVVAAHAYQSDAGLKILGTSGVSYIVKDTRQLYAAR
jgi:dCMP deaminase